MLRTCKLRFIFHLVFAAVFMLYSLCRSPYNVFFMLRFGLQHFQQNILSVSAADLCHMGDLCGKLCVCSALLHAPLPVAHLHARSVHAAL